MHFLCACIGYMLNKYRVNSFCQGTVLLTNVSNVHLPSFGAWLTNRNKLCVTRSILGDPKRRYDCQNGISLSLSTHTHTSRNNAVVLCNKLILKCKSKVHCIQHNGFLSSYSLQLHTTIGTDYKLLMLLEHYSPRQKYRLVSSVNYR